MDTSANPATPLNEVYQAFFDDLKKEDTKQSTIDRYRYNIVRFEKWLIAHGHPAILASLERSIPIGYKQYLETLLQQPRGSIRRYRPHLEALPQQARGSTPMTVDRPLDCDEELVPTHPERAPRTDVAPQAGRQVRRALSPTS